MKLSIFALGICMTLASAAKADICDAELVQLQNPLMDEVKSTVRGAISAQLIKIYAELGVTITEADITYSGFDSQVSHRWDQDLIVSNLSLASVNAGSWSRTFSIINPNGGKIVMGVLRPSVKANTNSLGEIVDYTCELSTGVVPDFYYREYGNQPEKYYRSQFDVSNTLNDKLLFAIGYLGYKTVSVNVPAN